MRTEVLKILFRLRIYIFIFLYIVVFKVFVYSQNITDAKIKVGYIYRFTEYINWPNNCIADTFIIGMFGSDKAINQALKNIESKTIKDKPVRFVHFLKMEEITKTNLLFVVSERNFDVPKIFKIISGDNTLLITDRCKSKRDLMINFFHDYDNNVYFEINSKNIDDANLLINSKLQTLGGSQIDIRKLYVETELSLKSETQRAEQIKKELENTRKELDIQINNLNRIKLEIENQKNTIETQRKEIANKGLMLNELGNKIEKQENILTEKNLIANNQKIHIEEQENKMKELHDEIIDRQSKVESFALILEQQKEEIDQQQENIDNQKFILSQQNSKIEKQQFLLLLLLIVVILVLALIFVILKSYKTKRDKNKELELKNMKISKQKEEIEIQTEEILSQKENLERTNAQLEIQHSNLKNAQSQLVESEKMATIGILAAGVAHEINNPINFINSGIEGFKMFMNDVEKLINMQTADNQNFNIEKLFEIQAFLKETDFAGSLNGIKSLIKDMKTGVNRATEIIKELRTFTRVDEATLKYTDIHQNIDSTLVLLRNEYQNKIEIVKEYGDIPKIECYPNKINQVFMNILTNSMHAIDNRGKITIKTSYGGPEFEDFIKIQISDTGQGIPENIQKRIFEPFFTTKPAGKGTGLGLSITKSIIDKHKGIIKCDSKIGEGSTFYVYLPIGYTTITDSLNN